MSLTSEPGVDLPESERPAVRRPAMQKMAGSTAMMQRDRASTALGMTVVTGRPGFAIVTMPVREDMLNGFDVMHGGMIFAVADTAFAIACNESDEVTLAAGAEITFLRPAQLGQTLTATATRRTLSGRTGIYDVQVTDGSAEVVAEFRGRSHITRLPVPTRMPPTGDGSGSSR